MIIKKDMAALSLVWQTLFSRHIEIETLAPLENLSLKEPCCLGIYTDQGNNESVGLLMSYPLACYACAALSIIPAPTANEALNKAHMPENLKANLNEIFNVSVAIFRDGSKGVDLRLNKVFIFPLADTQKLLLYWAKTTEHRNHKVNIAGYSQGQLNTLLIK